MKSNAFFSSFIGAISLALLSNPADAFTIMTDGLSGGEPGDQQIYKVTGLVEGDAFNLDWSLSGTDPATDTPFPDLSATGMVTIESLTSTELEFTVMIENTTTPVLAGTDLGGGFTAVEDLTAAISVFGMSVDGFSSGILSDQGTFLDTYGTGSVPGFNTQFCATTDPGANPCRRGNPQNSINIGENDTFTFRISGMFNENDGVTMRDFATKWQTNWGDVLFDNKINDSYELAGEPSPKMPAPGPEVPEPSAVLGMLGFTSFLFGLRRK